MLGGLKCSNLAFLNEKRGRYQEELLQCPPILQKHFDRQSSMLKGNLPLAGSEEAVYRGACLIWSSGCPLVWKTLGLWCLSFSPGFDPAPLFRAAASHFKSLRKQFLLKTYQLIMHQHLFGGLFSLVEVEVLCYAMSRQQMFIFKDPLWYKCLF